MKGRAIGVDGRGLVTPCDLHPGSYPCLRGLAVCLAFGMASLDHLLGPMLRDFPGFRWQLRWGWGLGKSQPQARSWRGGRRGVSWEAKVKVTHGSPCLVSLQSFVDTCLLVSSKISWTIPSLAFHPGLF